jgi:hypothetical protein
MANKGSGWISVSSFTPDKWIDFDITVNTKSQKYDLKLDNEPVLTGAAFAGIFSNTDNPYDSKYITPSVERIIFRTGPYRLDDLTRYPRDDNNYLQGTFEDLPGADEPVDNAVFDIDDFKTITK